jgi:hypothetical protein
MDYAIQICVNQEASGPPKVVRTSIEKGRPLDEVIISAKAYLKAAVVDGKIITGEGTIDLALVGLNAVFVQVVEKDGSPTGRVVLQKTLAQPSWGAWVMAREPVQAGRNAFFTSCRNACSERLRARGGQVGGVVSQKGILGAGGPASRVDSTILVKELHGIDCAFGEIQGFFHRSGERVPEG